MRLGDTWAANRKSEHDSARAMSAATVDTVYNAALIVTEGRPDEVRDRSGVPGKRSQYRACPASPPYSTGCLVRAMAYAWCARGRRI